MPQSQPFTSPHARRPLRVGVIGMGGFAGEHHAAIQQLERAGECQLVCTCDPNPAAFSEKMNGWQFAKRGVLVFDNYRDMLDACAERLDVLTIPTPVPLHAEMHRAGVERGLAVYLEKPPTLNPSELDAMLIVESRAHTQQRTNVGFNFIIEPARQQLKQRLLNGEFGALREVSFYGLWPRPHSYYQRAPWAGRLILDGRLVLDSCLGNAMAHYIHNVLFWAGRDDLFSWASVQSVEAECYRAHAIEGTDTIFLRAQVDGAVELRCALTHACDGPHRHQERLVCEHATITYVTHERYVIEWSNGKTETQAIPTVTLHDNLAAYLTYVRGESPRPATRLADSVPFVQLNALVYVAAGDIHTIPNMKLAITRDAVGQEWVVIPAIDDVVQRFLHAGRFPSAQRVAWGRTGGTATRADLHALHPTVQRMVRPLVTP
jgi:predicted dehydrogenase